MALEPEFGTRDVDRWLVSNAKMGGTRVFAPTRTQASTPLYHLHLPRFLPHSQRPFTARYQCHNNGSGAPAVLDIRELALHREPSRAAPGTSLHRVSGLLVSLPPSFACSSCFSPLSSSPQHSSRARLATPSTHGDKCATCLTRPQLLPK